VSGPSLRTTEYAALGPSLSRAKKILAQSSANVFVRGYNFLNGRLLWFFEKIFENFRFGNLGLRCSEVFTLNGFINFMAVNGYMTRSVYSYLDVS
jgi:hypothetical protein